MTEQNFRVRPLAENDASEWLRLRKLLWDESSEAEHRAEMLDIYEHTDTQFVSVAETVDGKIVGFLEASIRAFVEDCHSDHVGYLEGWFVETAFRRRGIGRKLVAAAERWARKKAARKWLRTPKSATKRVLQAHQNLGYEETSRLVHLRKDLD